MIEQINQLISITEILDNEQDIAITENTRMCFFIKYYEKIYLITAAHNITERTELSLKNNNVTMSNKKIFIPEIDLLIIELVSIEQEYFDIDQNNYFDNFYDISSKEVTYYNSKKQLCKIQDLTFKIANYNSICFPQMLKFIANCDNTNLAGSSGGPILMDGKILGLISGQIENRIQIIPFIFVKRVLDEYTKYGEFSGLCGFYYKTKLHNRNLFVTSNLLSHNYYIENTDTLKSNDLIIEIDGHPLFNSKIRLEQIDLEVDIDTYINLTKTVHDVINFKVLRNENICNVIIGCRDLHSSYNIDFDSTNYKFEIKDDDKYFMPVNSKTYEYFNKFRNLSDDKKLLSIFKCKISSKVHEKHILVFDNKNNFNILNSKYHDYFVLDF